MIKLLAGMFLDAKAPQMRVDICCKMVILIGDQDSTVKVWFRILSVFHHINHTLKPVSFCRT